MFHLAQIQILNGEAAARRRIVIELRTQQHDPHRVVGERFSIQCLLFR
jgi:hypothetical protein